MCEFDVIFEYHFVKFRKIALIFLKEIGLFVINLLRMILCVQKYIDSFNLKNLE